MDERHRVLIADSYPDEAEQLKKELSGKYNVISNNKLTMEINGELYSFKYKMQWDWSGKHGLTLKYKGKSVDLVKIKD